MKLKEMKVGIPYIVTKGGSTLHKGDRIRLDKSGDLMNKNAGGWLKPHEWHRLRNEVRVDEEAIIARIKKHKSETKRLLAMMSYIGGF